MGNKCRIINLPGLYDEDNPIGEHILIVWLVPQMLAVTTLGLHFSPVKPEIKQFRKTKKVQVIPLVNNYH